MDLLLPGAMRIIPLFAALLFASQGHAAAQVIPPDAKQLIVVSPAALTQPIATLRRFERTGPGEAWQAVGAAAPAVGGVKGFAWGWDQNGARGVQRTLLRKREGDKRTPMGVFALGRPFGLAKNKPASYLQLVPGKTFCVDDLKFPEYGEIVDRAVLPNTVTGEDMGTIAFYRSGFLVDFPANAKAKSGSCIFLHLWRGPKSGTAGCIAMDEATMSALHAWAKPGAMIAILPQSTGEKLIFGNQAASSRLSVTPPSASSR